MSVNGLAARREARKRKILENSEKRLTKILSCDKTNVSDSNEHLIEPEWKHCNGITTATFEPECVEPVFDAEPIHHLNLLNNEETFNRDTFPSQKDNFKERLMTEETLSNAKTTAEDKTHTIFQIDCLIIIILSFIVRLMYEYNFSYVFGESLLIPFITITVVKIAANPTKRNTNLAVYGSIIRASLLLSGIPSIWLDNIFIFVQLVFDLGNDFALYLFSFIITHIFLESFVIR